LISRRSGIPASGRARSVFFLLAWRGADRARRFFLLLARWSLLLTRWGARRRRRLLFLQARRGVDSLPQDLRRRLRQDRRLHRPGRFGDPPFGPAEDRRQPGPALARAGQGGTDIRRGDRCGLLQEDALTLVEGAQPRRGPCGAFRPQTGSLFQTGQALLGEVGEPAPPGGARLELRPASLREVEGPLLRRHPQGDQTFHGPFDRIQGLAGQAGLRRSHRAQKDQDQAQDGHQRPRPAEDRPGRPRGSRPPGCAELPLTDQPSARCGRESHLLAAPEPEGGLQKRAQRDRLGDFPQERLQVRALLQPAQAALQDLDLKRVSLSDPSPDLLQITG
jgi:hypothetical protein